MPLKIRFLSNSPDFAGLLITSANAIIFPAPRRRVRLPHSKLSVGETMARQKGAPETYAPEMPGALGQPLDVLPEIHAAPAGQVLGHRHFRGQSGGLHHQIAAKQGVLLAEPGLAPLGGQQPALAAAETLLEFVGQP